jgi:hypothetical protein
MLWGVVAFGMAEARRQPGRLPYNSAEGRRDRPDLGVGVNRSATYQRRRGVGRSGDCREDIVKAYQMAFST